MFSLQSLQYNYVFDIFFFFQGQKINRIQSEVQCDNIAESSPSSGQRVSAVLVL